MNRKISFVLATMMILASIFNVSYVFAADLPSGKSDDYISYILGYDDNTFRKDDYISKYELLTILARVNSYEDDFDSKEDISSKGEKYVYFLTKKGFKEDKLKTLINSENADFNDINYFFESINVGERTDKSLTRGEFVKILNKLLRDKKTKEIIDSDVRNGVIKEFSDVLKTDEDYYEIMQSRYKEFPISLAHKKEYVLGSDDVRYPNKLSGKKENNNSNTETSKSYYSDNPSKKETENSAITSKEPTKPSKARASISENVDNANGNYPIHRDDSDENSFYSADARQFISFSTKSGKEFYLVINHDEKKDNVLLLTEVSENDLLNMVEVKDEIKKEVPVKEIEDSKEEPKKEVKKESAMGTYLILILVGIAALGGGYYLKVYKKKEERELKELEEPEDDFITKTNDGDYKDSTDESTSEKTELEDEEIL